MGCVVTHIAVSLWISVPPFPCSFAEQGDIQKIGFIGIGDSSLSGSHFRRDKMQFDGIGMNSVVELGKGAVQIPGQRQPSIFILFEALKLLDQIKLEFRAEPGTEFQSNIAVGIGAPITAGAGDQTLGAGQLNPFFC
jgi:hypothetical protein